jgi:hypothetical protein
VEIQVPSKLSAVSRIGFRTEGAVRANGSWAQAVMATWRACMESPIWHLLFTRGQGFLRILKRVPAAPRL